VKRALFALVLCAACRPPPEQGGDDDGELPVSGDLAIVRVARWPAGGVELTMRVDGDLAPRSDLSGSITLAADDVDWQARPIALAPGYTAVLVRPGGDEAELRSFIAARPPVERLALFRWGAAVEQVVTFTADRDRLERGLAIALEPDDQAPLAADLALVAVADEVQEVGGHGPRVMRAVVVLGELEVVPTASPMPVVTGAAADAALEIDRLALETHYQVAACTGPTASLAALSVDGVLGELEIAWPSPWPESQDAGCDPGLIADALQPVPSVIEMVFSDEERAVYDQRVAALSKDDFSLSVRLAADQRPVMATAHLRGKGTLGCERKSYTVTLDGPGRHMFPDTYADEFYLVAMCADDRYIQLFTANQLLADAGLFPIRFRYVELILDGASRGVYLLLEKADDALVDGSSRVTAVLRRRFAPPDDRVEVEKSIGDPAAAAGAWTDFQASLVGLGGEELLAAASERIELDQYLTWLAMMSAFGNGDYVDEVWLTATEARAAGGGLRDHWEFTAWDNDDLFSNCHYSGNHAVPDPNQLAYCAEGNIDEVLLVDPMMYARYVDRLDELLSRLTPERLQDALDRTGAELLPWFERPEICAAMTELVQDNPGASDPAEAQRDLREHLAALRDQYESRRTLLFDRIEAYRAEF
jgi:hypothetical protein